MVVIRYYMLNGGLPDLFHTMKPIMGALLFQHENSFCAPLNGPLWYLPAILFMHVLIDLCRKTRHQQIWQNQTMPVFLPILSIAPSVLFQISRKKEEYCYDTCLQIPIVEPLLRLWQVAEYDAAYCECFRPVYPVDSFFHAAKIIISGRKTK